MHKMKNVIELIEKIKMLNHYQKKIKELSDENFNIFSICGVNHYENTHSSILAELLSNNSSHRFGNKFLEVFFDTLKRENILEDNFYFSLTNVKIIREYSTPFGRIDILIKNDNKCIIIENKIYADDQFEQLKRYDSFARKEFGNKYQLLYLTLWGDEASEHSGKGVNYKQISYRQTVINWLEKCVEISARNPIIRETLIQYINHIKSLTNNNSNSKMDEEIIKILSRNENLEATFTIGNSINSIKNYLINKVFLPQLSQICEGLGLICATDEYDRVNTAYAGFEISNPHWNYFKFGFEFETKGLRNFIIGINHKDENIRRDETFEKLKKYFNRNNQNWVWSDFPRFSYWDEEAMRAINNGEMTKSFKTELEKILAFTKDMEM